MKGYAGKGQGSSKIMANWCACKHQISSIWE